MITHNDIIAALQEHSGNKSAAARALGIPRSTLRNRLATLPAEQLHDGFAVTGISTYRRTDDGGQWIKESRDKNEQLAAMQAVVDSLSKSIPKEPPELDIPVVGNDDLLNTFVITDYHIGMNAWPDECGDAWDVHIAEELLVKWFQEAIRRAPQASTALFAQLGDFLHWDGLDAVTSSGNILEGDTRKPKLIDVALNVIRRVVSMLLKTHQHVHMIMAEGNHDMDGSIWLARTFNLLYEDEPRVTVDITPKPYYCYEFGKTSLFFHHGHKRRVSNVDTVFAADYREVYGRTKYSYAHLGHFHSKDAKEKNLMIVEQHPTLAAADSYATRGGWRSNRLANVITYHKEFGEVGRASITPEMVA